LGWAVDFYKDRDPSHGPRAERRDVAEAYLRLADLSLQLGRPEESRQYQDKAMETFADLARDGSLESQKDLMVAHQSAGELARSRGDVPDAERQFQKSLELQ